MRSPSEIAARAVQDELYARATFATLISRPASEFRTAVERDSRAQSEFMARYILGYYDEYFESTPPEHSLELIEAARLAARTGELHVRCRVEKSLANVLCYLGRFASSDATLQRASVLASRTLARSAHEATIDFTRATIIEATGHHDEATPYIERAIQAFEKDGAHDRASVVREYEAFRRGMRGEHVYALSAYQDVARRAREQRRPKEMARACYNIGLCYRELGDFTTAQRYFLKAARIQRARGVVVLEAKALRCVARMAIRVHGESAVVEMDTPKNMFLAIGTAGEVCRSTIAIIEELLLRDARHDIAPYVDQLGDEALTLGIHAQGFDAMASLNSVVSSGQVNVQALQLAWDAFGSSCALAAISAAETLEN